jgi:LPXTG-motif cell wall-anchored protein
VNTSTASFQTKVIRVLLGLGVAASSVALAMGPQLPASAAVSPNSGDLRVKPFVTLNPSLGNAITIDGDVSNVAPSGTITPVSLQVTGSGGVSLFDGVDCLATGSAQCVASQSGATATGMSIPVGASNIARVSRYGNLTQGAASVSFLATSTSTPNASWIETLNLTFPTGTATAPTVASNRTIDIPVTMTDPENDPVSIVKVTPAANSTVTIVGNKIHYVPATNAVPGNGDTVYYTVSDGKTATELSVQVNIGNPAPANSQPTATASAATTAFDTAVSIRVTFTDVDLDSVTLLSASALHGTATVSSSNISYKPTAGYSGADTVTYTFTDGVTAAVSSTVAVTVSAAVPAPPTPTPPAPTPSAALEPTGTAPSTLSAINGENFGFDIPAATDGSVRTIELPTPPAHGDVTFSDITPGSARSTRAALGASGTRVTYKPVAGFSGSDSFTYKVSDAAGRSYTNTVTVRVLAAPVAPAARPAAGLPATGRNTGPMTAAASALLLAGLGMIGIDRRRKADRS